MFRFLSCNGATERFIIDCLDLDLKFFLELMNHTPAAAAMATEGGSLGEISGSIVESIEAAREAFSADSVGELEPLFVARFATYIREHTSK